MASSDEILSKINAELEQLNKWVSERESIKRADKNQIKSIMKIIKENTAKIIQDAEPKEELDFGSFLTEIGDSIVDTQQQLDEQSRQYLEGIKQQPHILPSVFRIPKVSANIKFGMRKSSEKGFNIIINKQSETDETTLNQSMQFEILSVPPPPDFQQQFYNLVPSVRFIFSSAQRTAIFNDIERYKVRSDQSSGLKKDMLLEHQNDVLILQVEPTTKKDHEDYLITYADESADKNVGIWLLQRHVSDDPSTLKEPIFEMVLKFTASPRQGESYKILHDFVLSHRMLQQNILR